MFQGNADEIAGSATGYPFIQVLFNVTKSHAATDVLSFIIVITLTASVIACVATASRQLWAFARDKGVPFSNTVAYVSPPPPNSALEGLKTNQTTIGQPELECARQRGPPLSCCDQPVIPDQHWVLRRLERHSSARLRHSARVIYDQHRVFNAEAFAR